MSIQEILEAHQLNSRHLLCACGDDVSPVDGADWLMDEVYSLHRAHVAQMLEQHEREAKAEAVSEVANAFQYKAWSELIEGSLQDRLRIAQPITEWLRAQANQMRVGSE